MRQICLGLFLSMAVNASLGQNIDWKETKHWQLYDIPGVGGFKYSLDTLGQFKNISLSDDSMQAFLAHVSLIPVENTPVWMGYYVTSCHLLDSSIRKIEVSVYGGFFYDEKSKKYYELPLDLRTEWLNYFSDKAASIGSNTNN